MSCTLFPSNVGLASVDIWLFRLQDTMMMGADYYQTESEIASLLADGKVPIGVGQNTKIRCGLIEHLSLTDIKQAG